MKSTRRSSTGFWWLIAEAGLIKGERIGLDASTMEANAALRNIVRRDNGEGYREMLERLAGESGVETPTAEDLAPLERKRKGKKLSNTDWVSKSDPEAKIAKMKDGTTHLAYKPEHAVDLDTGAVVAAELHPADEGDTTTLSKTLAKAEANLEAVDAAPTSENPAECVADKGYHSRAVLRALNDSPWKTRIAAPKQTGFSRWHGDEAARRAVTNNRARLKSGVAREAFKLRAEIVERCFAHNLDRGGMRRTWLRGRENVHKRYLLHVAGHNLSLLMRQLIGAGTPREAVADGYGGIFVLLTPTGAMLVHGGSRKAARRPSPPHSSSGSESREKPLNQRAVQAAQHHRAHVLPPQGLAPYSHPLRPQHQKLHRRNRPCRRRHLVAVMSPDPRANVISPPPQSRDAWTYCPFNSVCLGDLGRVEPQTAKFRRRCVSGAYACGHAVSHNWRCWLYRHFQSGIDGGFDHRAVDTTGLESGCRKTRYSGCTRRHNGGWPFP